MSTKEDRERTFKLLQLLRDSKDGDNRMAWAEALRLGLPSGESTISRTDSQLMDYAKAGFTLHEENIIRSAWEGYRHSDMWGGDEPLLIARKLIKAIEARAGGSARLNRLVLRLREMEPSEVIRLVEEYCR
jgi:hypothetical protein